MDNKIKQLRKGILELAILGSLHNSSHYGYSLIKSISSGIDIDIAEGTIYPILSRLDKEGLIKSDWVESKQGPPRKYYTLTLKGKTVFEALKVEFEKLVKMVANAGRMEIDVDQDVKKTKISVRKEG